MGLFSSFKSGKVANASAQIWDSQLFMKLVEDTDDVTGTLIWQSFRSALEASLKEWKTAVIGRDYVRIRQIAHKIRSSSLLLGFREFAALSQKIEQSLGDGDPGSEIVYDLGQWPTQAQQVLDVLGEQPQALLGKQPIPLTEHRIDTDR